MSVLATKSMPADFSARPVERVVEFDLHGLMSVRLINPSDRDVSTVSLQLGLKPTTVEGDASLTVRFVEFIETSTPIRLLDQGDCGFTEDAFFLMPRKYQGRAKVQIQMNRIASGCEIVCEAGVQSIPLLTQIANLIVLSKGAAALHASAFMVGDTGVISTGWAKGGKTESLLAFMSEGASFIGDEWIYIDPFTKHCYGLDRPFGVWEWCLNQLPGYGDRIGRRARLRVGALLSMSKLMGRAVPPGSTPRNVNGRVLRKVLLEVERNLRVNLDPVETFGAESCLFSGPVDKVFFVNSHSGSQINVQHISRRELVRRMIFSLQYERRELLDCYTKFRFAFPHLRSALIEHCAELESEALTRAFSDKETYAVDHPYPVSLSALHAAMAPYCR